MFIVSGTGIGGAVVKDRMIHKGKHLHGLVNLAIWWP